MTDPGLPATTVAVMDTGIAPERLPHAIVLPGINLSGQGPEQDTTDRNGHGTAVASTIVSLAPRARLLPIKLMVDCGYLRAGPQLEVAFEWILQHYQAAGIGVVCASFADGSNTTDDQAHRGSQLQKTIARLRAAGIATVAPAGNRFGEHFSRNPQGLAWPAILREVVSAGALRRGKAGFQLTGRTQRLHASLGTGCYTDMFVEPGEPGDTSGAAAVVAGRLAAWKAACPAASVDRLTDWLRQRCSVAIDGATGQIWPALDVHDRSAVGDGPACL